MVNGWMVGGWVGGDGCWGGEGMVMGDDGVIYGEHVAEG